MHKNISAFLVIVMFFLFSGCGSDGTPSNNQVNDAPTVNAGADITITEGYSYTPLPVSSDSDGTIASTTWTLGDTILTFPKTDFSVGIHTLTVTVTDNKGASSSDDLILTVEAAKSKVLKTGQIISYTNFDDGYYQVGEERSYTRANDIVTDNTTRLQWQDNADANTTQKPWVTQANYDAGDYNNSSGDTATTYCDNLTLGGLSDWRLPTRAELRTLPDYSTFDPSIDSEFQNVASSNYWSSTTLVNKSFAAGLVSFYGGYQGYLQKSNNYYVRCVRAGQ